MHDKMKRAVEQRDAKHRENFQKNSNFRLKKIIEKKIMTTLIGSIALVEEYFGHLWGIGKADDELTDEQYDLSEIWADLRQALLDHGNHQKRAAGSEIDQYEMTWNRYHNVLQVKEQGQ